MKTFFKYEGLTPGNGKVYSKGEVRIVIYSGGTIRYWRKWEGGKGRCQERCSTGTYTFY